MKKNSIIKLVENSARIPEYALILVTSMSLAWSDFLPNWLDIYLDVVFYCTVIYGGIWIFIPHENIHAPFIFYKDKTYIYNLCANIQTIVLYMFYSMYVLMCYLALFQKDILAKYVYLYSIFFGMYVANELIRVSWRYMQKHK